DWTRRCRSRCSTTISTVRRWGGSLPGGKPRAGAVSNSLAFVSSAAGGARPGGAWRRRWMAGGPPGGRVGGVDRAGRAAHARPPRAGGKAEGAALTNDARLTGTAADALRGADVLIGVSGGQIDEDAVAAMAPNGIVFALANPTPEVPPEVAGKYAAVVATGRS